MKVLSLFSGIGGFDLGFERAGMEIVGMCEIDKHAQKILQRHFPDATLHDDVRKVHYARGSIDLICGGFPCQDLSVAGKRRGLDGERSGLWFEFARIIDETEPQWVVIENVPGLFSSDGGRDLATIIQWLANRGYGVGWRVLDSQGFGLAQRRKRVFIVASFGNRSGCTLLLEPESVRWDNTTSRGERQGDTGATAKCLTAHGQRHDYDTETMIPVVYAIDSQSSNSWKSQNPNSGIHEEQIARTIDTTGTNPTTNQGGNVIVPFAIQGNIVDRHRGGANGIDVSQDNISYTLTAVDRHAVAVQDIALTTSKPEHVLWESSHGYDPARVMSNQDIVPTLSAKMGTGGNNVPNIGVRRLTPIECERLQGFPDVQKSCIITIWEHYTDQQKNSVIAEILSHKLPKHVLNAESHELTESALSVVQNSLLKHQKDNKHVVVDVHINFERNTLEIRSHGKSHLSVNIAETQNLCHLPIKTGDFVQALVLITTIVGSEMHNGKVVSRQNMTHSIVQQNGKNVVVLSGKEIMEHAEDAVLNMPIINQSIKSITSEVEVSFLSYAQTLTTLCCYVSHVITSFIPDVTLPTSSLSLNLTTSKGWTAEQADTHRYKQLGNAVSVPVAHWIGKKIMEAENGK